MIIVFIPCRLKSSRYPNKGITPIYGISSVERSMLNALAIKGVDKVVLATSTDKADDALEKFNLKGRVEVVRGSEEDVLSRFMPVMEKYNPDHIIRITGDCPLVSTELAEILINEHLKNDAEATYTSSSVALGIACEVYKASAVLKLRKLFPETLHSEYLIYYFTNNPSHFKLNPVIAPDKFIKNWRLTFDEPSDLVLLDLLYKTLNVTDRAANFDEVINFFENNPEAATINIGNVVKYRDNKDLVLYLKNATTYSKA